MKPSEYIKEAERLLEASNDPSISVTAMEVLVAKAQVYATLANAEGTRRLLTRTGTK